MYLKLFAGLALSGLVAPISITSQCVPAQTERERAEAERERSVYLAHATLDDLFREEDFSEENKQTESQRKAMWASIRRSRELCVAGLTRTMITPAGARYFAVNLPELPQPTDASYETKIQHGGGRGSTIIRGGGAAKETRVEGYTNQTVGRDVKQRDVIASVMSKAQGDYIAYIDRIDLDRTRTRVFDYERGSLLDQANAAHAREEAALIAAEKAASARAAAERAQQREGSSRDAHGDHADHGQVDRARGEVRGGSPTILK